MPDAQKLRDLTFTIYQFEIFIYTIRSLLKDVVLSVCRQTRQTNEIKGFYRQIRFVGRKVSDGFRARLKAIDFALPG
jgi:hypothetical protein